MINRLLLTKIIIIAVTILILFSLIGYSINTAKLKDSNLNLNFQTSISCIKSICFEKNEFVKECIILGTPMLLKQSTTKDMSLFNNNIYEIEYQIINSNCN